MYMDNNLGFWGAFASIGKAAISAGKVAKTAAGVSKIAKVGSAIKTVSSVTKGASLVAKAANVASTAGKVLKVVSPISNKVGTFAQTLGTKVGALAPAAGNASNVAMSVLQAGAQIAPQIAAIRDGAQYGTPGYEDFTNTGTAYQVEPSAASYEQAQQLRAQQNSFGFDTSFFTSPGFLMVAGGAALLYFVTQQPRERVRYRTRYRRTAKA